MTTNTDRHRRISGLAAKLAGLAAGVMMSITVALGFVQSSHNSDTADNYKKAVAEVQFWDVVAGKKAPDSSSAANHLAFDLRDSLEQSKNSASAVAKDFAAGVGEYSGAQDSVGADLFDPAKGQCNDCGPLSDYAKARLSQVEKGQIAVIEAQIMSSAALPEGLVLTPFGMSIWLWLSTFYLVGGTLAALVAVKVDSKKEQYPALLLNWDETNTTADRYKRFMKLLAPGYVYVVVPLKEKSGKSYEHVLREIGLNTQYTTVRDLLNRAAALPEGDRKTTLLHQIENMRSEIEGQVADYVGKDREFQQQNADVVAASIEETLARIAEGVSDPVDFLDFLG